MHYYKGNAHDTYERVTSTNPGPLYINRYYRMNSSTYFEINSKGYLHVFKVTREQFNGKPLYYLNDYLLTDKDTLKDCGNASRYYRDREELIAFIDNLMKYEH